MRSICVVGNNAIHVRVLMFYRGYGEDEPLTVFVNLKVGSPVCVCGCSRT